MPYCQYKIQCMNCMSDSFLISEECNPIIYKCNGCNRIVVAHNDNSFTITENFFMKMVKEYNIKYCGKVVKYFPKNNVPNKYKKVIKKENISEEDLSKLHDFLVKAEDSSDIIEEL